MKIINPQAPEASAPTERTSVPESFDSARLETLERAASTLSQRLQSIDDRIKVLEEAPPPVVLQPEVKPHDVTPPAVTAHAVTPHAVTPPKPSAAPAPTVVTLDSEAVKANLLNKMWKYLNDQAAA